MAWTIISEHLTLVKTHQHKNVTITTPGLQLIISIIPHIYTNDNNDNEPRFKIETTTMAVYAKFRKGSWGTMGW